MKLNYILSLSNRNIRFLRLLVLLSFVISSFLKIGIMWDGHHPFSYDQARDLLDMRTIYKERDITLIGPTTSINGVYLGPAYYYLMLPGMLVGNGNPDVVLLWQILLYQLSGWIIIFLGKRLGKLDWGMICVILYWWAPIGFLSGRYIWNAHVMPVVMLWFLLSLVWLSHQRSWKVGVVAGIIAGIGLQTEAALGVLCMPIALLCLLVQKEWKLCIAVVGGFCLTLIPQALFEVRHGFVMSKIFLANMGGDSALLGTKMEGWLLLKDRINAFYKVFILGNHLHPGLVFSWIIMAIWSSLVFYKNKNFRFYTHQLALLVSVALLVSYSFFVWYGYPLKSWYLLGLAVPVVFILGLPLSIMWKRLPIMVLVLLVATSLISTKEQVMFWQSRAIRERENPSTLLNQREVISQVESQLLGNDQVYVFVPEIYPYEYIYLFDWQLGEVRDLSIGYAPGVPDYVSGEDLDYELRLGKEVSRVILVMEPQGYEALHSEWLGKFGDYCVVNRFTYEWGTIIEERVWCKS